MFVAMNRFRITPGREEDFERIWRERESHLASVPGFRHFALVKGPAADDHSLYATHVIWDSRDSFDAWTKSDAFRQAHAKAGGAKTEGVYLGPPQFEGFEPVLMEGEPLL